MNQTPEPTVAEVMAEIRRIIGDIMEEAEPDAEARCAAALATIRTHVSALETGNVVFVDFRSPRHG